MDEKYSILIVEDHALTAFALKTSLSTLEYIDKIFEANCASDAYNVINNNEVDLIIMDLGLPDIDGVNATKTIRETNKEVKIIVLTSHCEKDEVLACLESGINAYCTKDIKPDKLAEVIKDVLSGSMYFDSSVSKYVMFSAVKTNNDKEFNNISIKDCYNLTQQEKRVFFRSASHAAWNGRISRIKDNIRK